MPWRSDLEDAVKAKLGSSGLTIGYYNCDGNVSFVEPWHDGVRKEYRFSHILRYCAGLSR